MDGTFGGGDLISASLAIMLGGNGDAELHDKEVTLTTSDVTGSQTAVFEYDPQNEPVTGTPPGPWDGYSLFTIDLSGVKDDIEDLQQQLSDLEDCRDAVIAKIQEYDPQFDPQDCQDIVDKIDEDEQAKEDAEQAEDELEQCRDAVIAKIQEYFPSFDPQTCQDLVDKIEEDEDDREDAEEHEGYTFPKKPTGDNPDIDDIFDLVGGDPVENNGVTVRFYVDYYHNDEHTYFPIHEKMGGDTGQDGTCNFMIEVNGYAWSFTGHMCNLYTGSRIDHITIDSQDGHIEYDQYFWNFVWSEPNHGHWDTTPTHKTNAGSQSLISYGDGSYKVKNS